MFEPAHGAQGGTRIVSDDDDNGDGDHVVDACVLHTEEQTSPPSARQHCPPLSIGIRRLVLLSSDGDNGF